MLSGKDNTRRSLPVGSSSAHFEAADVERFDQTPSPRPVMVLKAEAALRVRDRILLGVAIAVLLLGLSMSVLSGGERVCFRFAPEIPLPQTCASRWLFGIDCPGCGLTRSIVFLLHGHLKESLKMHRLGCLVLLLIVLQIPYRLWCLSGNRTRIPWSQSADRLFWGGLLGLMVLNWIGRWR